MAVWDIDPGDNPRRAGTARFYTEGADPDSGVTLGSDGAIAGASIDAPVSGALRLVSTGPAPVTGRVTLPGTGAGVVVSTTAVTADSNIICTVQIPAGSVGAPRVHTRTAGVSFEIRSSQTTDTSVVGWVLTEPV